MIVISGALVLVALVLLVIGLIDPNLGFVYASIGVSLASFAFLVVGILQRRKEDVPGTEAAAVETAPSTAAEPEGVSTLPTILRKAAGRAEEAAPEAVSAGSVLVVAGRPRYHAEGCRYLTGKDADEVGIADAREEGFTACGVCKPDDNLTPAAASVEDTAPVTMTKEPAPAKVARAGATTTLDKAVVAAQPAAIAAPAKKAAKTAPPAPVTTSAAKAPVKTVAAKAPAKAAAKAATKAPAKAASSPAKKAPAKAASSPAKKAAAAPVKRGGVIVIPDRGKFHTPECRYVRGAEGTLELTKAAATKQGYDACGVCNP